MEAFSMVAEKWLRFYGLHTIETSLFILLIFAVDRFFRLDTKLRYLLLMLALIKAFIPPIFSAPQQVAEVVSAQLFMQPIQAMNNSTQPATLTMQGLFLLLWLTSVIAILGLVFWQNVKLRHKLKSAKWIYLRGYEELAANFPHKPELYASSDLQTPLLRGFFHPKLYLPAAYKSWPQQHLHSVIAHEIAHLKSRDMWVLALQTLSLIFFGLNPLIWILHRKLLHIRELRCDEIAIQETGITPVEYSKLLYTFLEMQSRRYEILFSGAYFAQNKKTILGRFQHLLSLSETGQPSRKLLHFAFPILATVFLIPFSWQCYTIPLAPEHLIDAPPPSEQTRESVFIAYDHAPEPVGGFAAIQKNLQYPEIARKAGIEGRVILNVLIAENGEVERVKVLKSLGHNGCDEAAVNAVRSVKWKPAMQKGQPVKVWVGIPVVFKLASGSRVFLDRGDFGDRSIQKIDAPTSPLFIPYDNAPEPIGGFAAIQKNLQYPEIARKAGIEGRVIVNILVNENGQVDDVKILKSLGQNGCDQAAANAVRSVKWKPAMQKGQPVKVWVGIPVIFKLK